MRLPRAVAVACLLSMFLLVIFGVQSRALSPSTNSVDLLGQPGPYAIGFTSFLAVDPARPGVAGYEHRPVPVHVFYPVDPKNIHNSTPQAVYPLDLLYDTSLSSLSSEWEAMGYYRAYQEPPVSGEGPFPLVVMSPGWSAPPWMHNSIGTRLASYGFIVAIPFHTGDQWFSYQPAQEHIAWALYNRPRDVSFVLTTLLQRNEANGDLLHGTIDPERLAAAGWSLGGYASMVIAAGDETVWDYGWIEQDGPIPEDVPHSASLPDPRFKTIVTLDGSNQCLLFEELSKVNTPALSLGEEWNAVADWQARQHAAFSSHPAYRVDLAGANHQSFSDMCDGFTVMNARGLQSFYGPNEMLDAWLCQGVIPPPQGRDIVTRYMIAFLKTQLLGETGYQAMLTPGWALTRATAVEFFVTEKRNASAIDADWPGFFVYFAHQPGSAQFRAEKNGKNDAPLRIVHRRR